MEKIGVHIAIATLAAVIILPTPAAAFVLHIGPYRISVPLYGRRHHHHPTHRYAVPNEVARPAARADLASALLYPRLALPAIFARIFSPTASAWPFDYSTVFRTAFAGEAAQWRPQLCQQQSDLASTITAPLRSTIEPTDMQMQFLQKLGGAIAGAEGLLATSCPSQIPAQPVARLHLIASQIKELPTALNSMRQPLQDFQQSLNDEQRARFAVMIAAPAAPEGSSEATKPGCGDAPGAVDSSIAQIDHAVQATDAERGALADLKQGLAKAANDLEAQCKTPMLPTALSRLQAIEASLDAVQRDVLSITAVLEKFESTLSEEQKARFEAMHFATRQ